MVGDVRILFYLCVIVVKITVIFSTVTQIGCDGILR